MATPSLPNVPYKTPLTDSGGFLSAAWAGFFRELYARLGGSQAPSLSDVDERLDILQGEITTLDSEVTSLQDSITGSNGFGVGPVL